MQDLPHNYAVAANADAEGLVTVSSEGLEDLETAAIARASRLEWSDLNCDVSGRLDKLDKVTQFTGFDIGATLTVPEGSDQKKAHRLMEKAERHCLITNSMKAGSELTATIKVSN